MQKKLTMAWNDFKKAYDMVLQTWMIYLQMYKISNKVMNEIAAGRLFVIAMIPLNYILKKFTGRYKFTKSQENINHLMYMDDMKIFT